MSIAHVPIPKNGVISTIIDPLSAGLIIILLVLFFLSSNSNPSRKLINLHMINLHMKLLIYIY